MIDRATIYEVVPDFAMMHQKGTLVLAGNKPEVLQIDGESAALIEKVAQLLRLPRRIDEMLDALGPQIDPDELVEVVEWLCGEGFVQQRPATPVLRYPALAGDPGTTGLVIGESPIARAAVSALAGIGVASHQIAGVKDWTPEVSRPRFIVGVFDSLFDPAIRRLNELALQRAVPFVPVVRDNQRVFIGPLVEAG
ncbi:MAG: hypothetical protein JXR83_00750, partial [Deltaproteobacteria bacterium]|nr:hypothetical protein [Deltaproteobacteria bacterium]